MSNAYTDLIITVPNGFAPALNELYSLGFSEFIRFDEETKQAIGLNKLYRFYPSVPTFFDPAILYLRGESGDIKTLLVDSADQDNPAARVFTNLIVLIQCRSQGEPVYDTIDGIETIIRHMNIYEKLQAKPDSLALYNSFIFWPEFLEDGVTVNPKNIPTIEVEDGEGGMIIIPNPQYAPFRCMGKFA